MIDGISSFSSLLRTQATRPAAEVESAGSAAAATGVAAPQPTGALSFSDVMSDIASNAVNSLKQGEATSIYGVQGKASVQKWLRPS